jgi:hypothetical protein
MNLERPVEDIEKARQQCAGCRRWARDARSLLVRDRRADTSQQTPRPETHQHGGNAHFDDDLRGPNFQVVAVNEIEVDGRCGCV